MLNRQFFLFFQGGIIARALFTLPDFDPRLVNTIITQATPHQAPGTAHLFIHFSGAPQWPNREGDVAQ